MFLMKVFRLHIVMKEFLVCEESFKFLPILDVYYAMNDTKGLDETS